MSNCGLLKQFSDLSDEHKVEINVRDFNIRESGVEYIEKLAANLDLGIRRMQTTAGHDSVALNRIVPSVMVFIPFSRRGLALRTGIRSDEDMTAGVKFLTLLGTDSWSASLMIITPLFEPMRAALSRQSAAQPQGQRHGELRQGNKRLGRAGRESPYRPKEANVEDIVPELGVVWVRDLRTGERTLLCVDENR